MSYALESKKRKFERIIESFTDGAASKSRISLNSRNDSAVLSSSNQSTDAFKRRRITPTSVASKAASTTSLTGHYLPSSRQAFLERLETYRQVTKWHIPSTEPVNAAAWARRGWVCIDNDTVFCGSCKERLTLDLNDSNLNDPVDAQNANEDEFALSRELHAGLVKRYQEMIITAHAESCPWRKRGSDGSIQRIEGLLNTTGAVSALQARYDSMVREIREIPAVAPFPGSGQITGELDRFEFDESGAPAPDAFRLAVCGWQRKDEDVIDCRYCFRSLGLWLYRGEDPAMDKLDAIESHLEYCPWRSPEAQDTELTLPTTDGHQKTKLAGWQLVLQAIAKNNAKRRVVTNRSVALSEITERPVSSDSMTDEQREKRRSDLMRRIKELKKPFTFKNLIRKKDKSRA